MIDPGSRGLVVAAVGVTLIGEVFMYLGRSVEFGDSKKLFTISCPATDRGTHHGEVG